METEKKQGFYVIYQVAGFPGDQLSGPYPTWDAAELQRADIKAYAGVSGVYVTENPTNAKEEKP